MDNMDKQVLIRTTEILLQAGIPVNLRGFSYLRTAIVLTVKDVSVLSRLTRGGLYSMLAEQEGTTPLAVERSTRYAVEEGWKRGNPALLEELFGWSVNEKRSRPTNSEFIMLVADKIRMEMMQ